MSELPSVYCCNMMMSFEDSSKASSAHDLGRAADQQERSLLASLLLHESSKSIVVIVHLSACQILVCAFVSN